MIVDESVGESSYQFCVQWSDVEFVKSFTLVRFPFFSILPDKIEDVLIIHLGQIVNFCAIIYSNTKSFQLFCESSCLYRQISQIG